MNPLENLLTQILGKSAPQTEETPTGYKMTYKQVEPNILQRIQELIGNIGKPQEMLTPVINSNPTTSQYQQPAPTATPYPMGQARNPSFSKFNVSPEVNTALQTASEKYDLIPSILYDIALQESSFNPSLTNTTPEGVQAGNPKGLFQFTDPTWSTVQNYANQQGGSLDLPTNDRFDPLTNALAAAYLIKMGQLGRWDASKDVWGQYYKPEEIKPYYAQTLGSR